MVFQDMLSAHDPRVSPLRRSLQASDPTAELINHWQFILSQIDYVPIFRIARELLLALSASPDIDNAIRFMAERALDIVRRRAALRHDLMGRVYHRLLAEAKYLGTYYTSVSAATLLLGALVSFAVGLAALAWLIRWIQQGQLHRFAWWLLLVGLLVVLWQLAAYWG